MVSSDPYASTIRLTDHWNPPSNLYYFSLGFWHLLNHMSPLEDEYFEVVLSQHSPISSTVLMKHVFSVRSGTRVQGYRDEQSRPAYPPFSDLKYVTLAIYWHLWHRFWSGLGTENLMVLDFQEERRQGQPDERSERVVPKKNLSGHLSRASCFFTIACLNSRLALETCFLLPVS